MDCQPVVDGKARVALGEAGDSAVSLKLGDQRRERAREGLQERDHLGCREQVFHHHETHEVQAGIAVGTILGLVSHSARLLLVEGSVPTAIFGVACLASLWARHPLMFSFAREFTGPDTVKGQEMTRLWQYEGYRRVFRVITVVWGVAFLIEAAARVVIVYHTSAGTAPALSKVTPFLFFGFLTAWTVAYGAHHKKKGARMAAATSEVTEASPAPDAK